MLSTRTRTRLLTMTLFTVVAVTAQAQPLGTFRWQLQPYCNVVTLTVVQQGGQYQLDGTDDQCGADRKAAVTGLAFVNPDGTVGFGLAIVSTPGGRAVHVDATIALASLSGTWRDATGATGTFILTPGAGIGGPARPAPTTGAGDVTGVAAGSGLAGGGVAGDVTLSADFATVQARVGQGCPSGQAVRAIAQSGTVTCEPVTGGAISAVAAGAGLIGGGNAGTVTLAVAFGGSGSAAEAARADHTHAVGLNTSVGAGAFGANTTGLANTAVGRFALAQSSTASNNTAVGNQALYSTTSGINNTALGGAAMASNTTGDRNTAVGLSVLFSNTSGVNNTAVGVGALDGNTTGSGNIVLGAFSGRTLTTGSNNIYIGADGAAGDEEMTMRLGTGAGMGGAARAFIGGVRGRTTGVNDALPVVIDSNGQLGTISSSLRTKDDIEDLGGASRAILDLRPVQFTYRQPFADGSRPLQYGLIAEEVERVMPGLVAYGADGLPESVKYHVLPTLLLAEVQRLERERAALKGQLELMTQQHESLSRRLAALETQLRRTP